METAKIEHYAFRLYPHGWTGNSIGELNDMLSKGWIVKFIVPEGQQSVKAIDALNVLILERETPITLT